MHKIQVTSNMHACVTPLVVVFALYELPFIGLNKMKFQV